MQKVTVYLGSDHAGFRLKEAVKSFLPEIGYPVKDMGADELDPEDDYPDYAERVCEQVLRTGGRGILCCGSGQGMAIAANSIPGIYAVICSTERSARKAREQMDTNVLCLGEKTVEPELARGIVKVWLETPFTEEERHVRRFGKIRAIEGKYMRD